MKWLDTVMFNGEPVLKARIEYLAPFVDTFYICEQRYTHQGSRKDVLFTEKHKDWFTPYTDKIRILIDETNYSGNNKSWVSENAQRNYSVPYILADYPTEQFIVSVCDVDEIPDATVVKSSFEDIYSNASNGAVCMDQPLFYYNLNWYVGPWRRAFLLNDVTLKQYPNVQLFRNMRGPFSSTIHCGWHMSYFLAPEDIRRKLESFAHTECNIASHKEMEYIRDCIRNGKNVNNSASGFRSTPQNILDSVPDVLRRFHEEMVSSQLN